MSALRRRWYPERKKRCPMDFTLTREVALQWYLGDGCFRHGYTTLCAEWYNLQEITWLHDCLEAELGSGTVRLTVRRGGHNLEMTLPGTRKFLAWIGPSPADSLRYKWGPQ